MALFGVLWLVLLAVGVGLIVWSLMRRGRSSDLAGRGGAGQAVPSARPGHGLPGPLAILDERLARGEIDVETYRALRAELTASAPPAPPTAPYPPSAQ
jgi:hypothetical protein